MPHAVTLPQWFRKFGYTAVSHGEIFHNPTPDPQSWSEPIRPSPRLPSGYPAGTPQRIREAQLALSENDWRKNNLRGPSTAAPEFDDDQLIDGARTEMAIEDLVRLGKADEPFFLAMGYIRPHLAWIAPKKYWDLYDPTTLPVIIDGKVTNYEIDTRVPLIIAAPGLKTAGQQTSELAELLDLFPTLCDLAGIDKPDFVDGNSLLPTLQDTTVATQDAAYSQYYRNFEGGEYMGYAIRTDSYRFIQWRDFGSGAVTDCELYDHRTDPFEAVNIADSAPREIVDRLTG